MCCSSQRCLLNSRRGNVRTCDDFCAKRLLAAEVVLSHRRNIHTRMQITNDYELAARTTEYSFPERLALQVSALAACLNYTINRRNRRASDYLQDEQRDRQTRSASSSSERLAGLLFCVVSIKINQGTSTAGKSQGR